MVRAVADADYRIVAHVRADGVVRELMCSRPLAPQEANLLYMLSECIGRPVPMVDLCHRLKITLISVRCLATKIRRKLHHDWVIDTVRSQGMRLCFIGDSLARADQTKLDLDYRAPRKWNRRW